MENHLVISFRGTWNTTLYEGPFSRIWVEIRFSTYQLNRRELSYGRTLSQINKYSRRHQLNIKMLHRNCFWPQRRAVTIIDMHNFMCIFVWMETIRFWFLTVDDGTVAASLAVWGFGRLLYVEKSLWKIRSVYLKSALCSMYYWYNTPV